MKNKNYIHHVQEQCSIWSWFLVHRGKMMIFAGSFFFSSKFWFFGLFLGGKGKKWSKMTQNDKHSVHGTLSQEPYIVWLFMVHMCKIISSGVFRPWHDMWAIARAHAITCANQEKGDLHRRWKAHPNNKAVWADIACSKFSVAGLEF